MANSTPELKAISANHLKQLLKETGVGKKELADKIGRSAQTISALVGGKSVMSERTAGLINGIYPDYSVEWLTGVPSIQTHTQRPSLQSTKPNTRVRSLRQGFVALLSLWAIRLPEIATSC